MAEVKKKKSKPYKVIYIEHTGAYEQIPYDKYYEKLYGYVKQKGLRPAGPPMAIFLDSPETPPEKRRSEILVPIQGEATPEAEIKIKEIPEMDVATITHRGPTKEYPQTYEKLHRWIAENNYVWAGPPMEIYLSKPKIVQGETVIFSAIQVPIKKGG